MLAFLDEVLCAVSVGGAFVDPNAYDPRLTLQSHQRAQEQEPVAASDFHSGRWVKALTTNATQAGPVVAGDRSCGVLFSSRGRLTEVEKETSNSEVLLHVEGEARSRIESSAEEDRHGCLSCDDYEVSPV